MTSLVQGGSDPQFPHHASQKFTNPYHGKDGKFTSKGGGGAAMPAGKDTQLSYAKKITIHPPLSGEKAGFPKGSTTGMGRDLKATKSYPARQGPPMLNKSEAPVQKDAKGLFQVLQPFHVSGGLNIPATITHIL